MCSVIVPCFNAQETVAATIASALASPAVAEVICVDDGSTDATPAILSGLAEHEPRLVVIAQTNCGVAAARNRGIAAARSAIIAFLDSDDIWHAGHVERHIARFAVDDRLGVSFSTARFIDCDGKPSGYARPRLDDLQPVHFLAGNPCTTCSTMVVRARVLRECGAFNPALRHNEDLEWLFRVAVTGWKIAGIADVLVDYRTSREGLAANLDGMLAGFEAMLAEARRIAPEIVAHHEHEARAMMHRYLARRAIRLRLPGAVARHHMRACLAAWPRLAVAEPWPTLATLAAAFVPAGIVPRITSH